MLQKKAACKKINMLPNFNCIIKEFASAKATPKLKNKSMKNVSFLIAFSLTVTFFYSCNKESLNDEIAVATTEATDAECANYYVTDGVLCFNSAEDYMKLNDQLSQMELSEIQAWEKSIGFTSFRTAYFSVLERIDTIEVTEEYNQLLDANSDILYEKDGFVEPVIKQTSYQRTANRDGLFVIAGILQKVTKNELLVFENSCTMTLSEMVNISSNASNSTKIISLENELRLKSTYCGDYYDVTSAVNKSKYKCKIVASVSRHPLYNAPDVLYCYEVSCTSTAWAKDLIGSDFDKYNTIHSHDAIEIIVEAPKTCCCTGGFSFEDVTISLDADETTSTCKTKIWIDGERIGDYVVNEVIPSPEFKRIKGNFWTRGSYPKLASINCGYAN